MLTIQELYSLLYGFDEFFGERPISLLYINDQEHFKIRLIPAAMGVTLKNADKDESYFHIEIFATHAELWSKADWERSASRRLQFAGYKMEELRPEQNLRAELGALLLQHFRKLGIPPRQAYPLTEMFTSGKEIPHLVSIAGLPENIKQKYEEWKTWLLTHEKEPDDADLAEKIYRNSLCPSNPES